MSLHLSYEQAAASLVHQGLPHCLDPMSQRLLSQSLQRVQADEGTLWLINPSQQCLQPVFNHGPHAESFLAKVRQPLDRGMISMVYHSGQSICENDIAQNSTHDASVDREMSQSTSAMIAVPFYLADSARGVFSCVRLGEGQFEAAHLEEIQFASSLLERLIGWQILQYLLHHRD